MKKIIALVLVLSFVLAAPAVFAAPQAADRALEKASQDSVINRTTDWFATRGKSPEEAKAIIAERRAKRMAARAEKEAKKQAKIAQKEAEKQAKKTKAAMKGLGKK